jgi:hypothetical protein
VHFRLLGIPPLRSGLGMFLCQNLILMGIFFAIPLYLQIVQGFDTFETGLRMLPVSVALFVTALAGSRLAGRFPARAIVRGGLALLLVASVLLLADGQCARNRRASISATRSRTGAPRPSCERPEPRARPAHSPPTDSPSGSASAASR